MPPIRVYTTSYCPYCTRAIALLKKKGAAFEEIDCTDDEPTRIWLVDATGRKTVPQIFVGEVPVGGCDDLYLLEKRGVLDSILAGSARAESIAADRSPGPPPR